MNKISLLALIATLLAFEPFKIGTDRAVPDGWADFERAIASDCRVGNQALLEGHTETIQGMLPCTVNGSGLPLPGAAP